MLLNSLREKRNIYKDEVGGRERKNSICKKRRHEYLAYNEPTNLYLGFKNWKLDLCESFQFSSYVQFNLAEIFLFILF